MKKRLLLIASSLLLTACSSSNGGSLSSSSSSRSLATYSVSFANTNFPDQSVKEGDVLQEPSEPAKDGYLFVGWYLDEGCTKEAYFPLLISDNTTIYACFYSYDEAYKKARKNTIGEDVAGYEYDYLLDLSLNYAGAALTGKTAGNSKYKAKTGEISYYDEHGNSGALFYDGTKYKFKKGTELHEISLDENGIMKGYDITTVDDDYKYDSSSFAKAVFEYDESNLKSIEETSIKGEFKLNTAFNFSSALAIIGSYVNHPMVESVLGKLPETSVNTAMYVTFDKTKLSSYRYTMNIDVQGFKMDLSYSLSFINIGKAPTINPKTFDNVYLTSSDIAKAKIEVEDKISAYKALTNSSYEYKAKTAVGYEGKNDINATVKGFTKRKVSGSDVYFFNDYEVDTDHKNADLYKSAGLDDVHAGRVKLANGEVHDIKKKWLGGYEDVKTVSPYSDEQRDSYYLLGATSFFLSPSFIQKSIDEKEDEIVYSFGRSDEMIKGLLTYFNDTLILDPLDACSVDVFAFGDFGEDSIAVDDFECELLLKSGSLYSITISMNGMFEASFPESRDFLTSKEASFKLEFSLEASDDGNSYDPPSEASKVK